MVILIVTWNTHRYVEITIVILTANSEYTHNTIIVIMDNSLHNNYMPQRGLRQRPIVNFIVIVKVMFKR